MNLSDQNVVKRPLKELILMEVALANKKKSMTIAVVLWAVFGFVGGHDFYFHRVRYAILKIVLLILSWLLFLPRLLLEGVVGLAWRFRVWLSLLPDVTWLPGIAVLSWVWLSVPLVILLLWWISDGFLLRWRIQEDIAYQRQKMLKNVKS